MSTNIVASVSSVVVGMSREMVKDLPSLFRFCELELPEPNCAPPADTVASKDRSRPVQLAYNAIEVCAPKVSGVRIPGDSQVPREAVPPPLINLKSGHWTLP
ncbi:MAG: hypothetical protein QGH39_04395 [Candidatus Thermoplasmatota archaeon]|jgi:hypothetical protein|nr:hypothetical protein [Candidatus Thermoplasmatota archaeon]MDP7264783.1 hypothetical protein [Candidatus Thermoplasmatota archaeon]